MKRFFCSLLIVSIIAHCYAQKTVDNTEEAEKIMANDEFIYGEGEGNSRNIADENAIQDLMSRIFGLTIKSETTTTVANEQQGKEAHSRVNTESVVKSYVSGRLPGVVGKLLVYQEENYHKYLRYIKKKDVDSLFTDRVNAVREYVKTAEGAEKEKRIGVALQNYYFAKMMLTTLRAEDEEKVKLNEGSFGRVSASPELDKRIKNILEKIDIKIGGRQKGSQNYEVYATYDGEPVASLIVTYFDGNGDSDPVDFGDGKAMFEIPSDFPGDKLEVKIEYQYEHELKRCGRQELIEVYNSVDRIDYDDLAIKFIDFDKGNVQTAEFNLSTEETMALTNSLSSLSDEDVLSYHQTIVTVLETIRQKKNFSSIEKYFTPQGYDVFTRLIDYGRAKIIGSDIALNFTELNGYVTCRSVPMQFDFNAGRRFTENVVFVFNDSLKLIDNISFGLSEVAKESIMGSMPWSHQSKEVLVSFLENYKTAYALERYDYLDKIFSEHALIITGSVVNKATTSIDDPTPKLNEREVKYRKQTKQEYLERLKTVFDSNEFINIKFAQNEMKKLKDELYFIQIKQDYYSENYGDSGWLTLRVDVNDPQNPIIYVRVWEENYNPNSPYSKVGSF